MISSQQVILRSRSGKKEIYDPVRRAYFIFTPEEWVRQCLIQYLVNVKNYPLGLLSVEKEITLYDTYGRYDLIAFENTLSPFLTVECKAPGILLTEKIWLQAISYDKKIGTQYLGITNGYDTLCVDLTNSEYLIKNDFPEFLGK